MKLLLTSHRNSPHLGQPVLLRHLEHPCWDPSAEQSHVFHRERLKEEKDPMLLHGDARGTCIARAELTCLGFPKKRKIPDCLQKMKARGVDGNMAACLGADPTSKSIPGFQPDVGSCFT